MGCCLARLQRFIEAEKILRRAVCLYEKDGRDWCNIEIGRVNSLRRAIQQGRSDECLIGWTRESVSKLALDALVIGNPAQQPVAPEP